MKRRLVIVGEFLVAGALVNMAVAWGSVFLQQPAVTEQAMLSGIGIASLCSRRPSTRYAFPRNP